MVQNNEIETQIIIALPVHPSTLVYASLSTAVSASEHLKMAPTASW